MTDLKLNMENYCKDHDITLQGCLQALHQQIPRDPTACDVQYGLWSKFYEIAQNEMKKKGIAFRRYIEFDIHLAKSNALPVEKNYV